MLRPLLLTLLGSDNVDVRTEACRAMATIADKPNFEVRLCVVCVLCVCVFVRRVLHVCVCVCVAVIVSLMCTDGVRLSVSIFQQAVIDLEVLRTVSLLMARDAAVRPVAVEVIRGVTKNTPQSIQYVIVCI